MKFIGIKPATEKHQGAMAIVHDSGDVEAFPLPENINELGKLIESHATDESFTLWERQSEQNCRSRRASWDRGRSYGHLESQIVRIPQANRSSCRRADWQPTMVGLTVFKMITRPDRAKTATKKLRERVNELAPNSKLPDWGLEPALIAFFGRQTRG